MLYTFRNSFSGVPVSQKVNCPIRLNEVCVNNSKKKERKAKIKLKKKCKNLSQL